MEAAYARWQNGGPLRPTPSGAEEATTLMGATQGNTQPVYVVLSSDFGPSREARPNDNPFREPLTASGEGSARLGSGSTDNRVNK